MVRLTLSRDNDDDDDFIGVAPSSFEGYFIESANFRWHFIS